MKKICMLIALTCLLLTSCGNVGSAAQDQSERNAGEQSAAQSRQGGGTFAEESVTLNVKKVDMMRFQAPEEGYVEQTTSYKVIGDKIYMVRAENREDGSALRLCVQSYDVNSTKIQQWQIVPDIPGQEDSVIVSAELTAGLELSLKLQDAGQEENAFALARMNLEGEVLRVEDVFPQDNYPWNQDRWLSNVTALDLSDGRTVICRNDYETFTATLSWYHEDAAEESLGTLEHESISAMAVDAEGTLYYLGGEGLVRYDTQQNTQEVLFRMQENGISPTNYESCGIAMNDRGQLLLCMMHEGKSTIYILTDEEIPEQNKIRLCSLTGRAGIGYFQSIAATFSQRGGKAIGLELEEKEGYENDYRNRIMAEMVAGKGPDILFVTQSDMMLLQEKGLICDISEMISPEIKSVLIPGVIELGTVNGEWVGLVPEVSFTTMSVANQVWDQSGWTVDEFIEQLEEKDRWEVLINWAGFSVDGPTMFLYILFSDLADSSVLNLEQRTCDFYNERLIHILEFCKKYGSAEISYADADRPLSDDERMRMFREGEMAAEMHSIYGGQAAFSTLMARNGDDCHFVGYPTEKGSGSYVDSYSYGYLVVNAQTKYKEEIKEYFELLLDYDSQFHTSGCSVRMDVVRDNIVYIDLDGRGEQFLSYPEEFLEFVQGCEPRPYCPPDISQIVREEINLFFNGSKSAEETARVIQSRVQLYLEEMK